MSSLSGIAGASASARWTADELEFMDQGELKQVLESKGRKLPDPAERWWDRL